MKKGKSFSWRLIFSGGFFEIECIERTYAVGRGVTHVAAVERGGREVGTEGARNRPRGAHSACAPRAIAGMGSGTLRVALRVAMQR